MADADHDILARVAAEVVGFTVHEVINCWDDPSMNPDRVFTSILKALHHPSNIIFGNPDSLQYVPERCQMMG